MIYTRENTLRMLAFYHRILLTAPTGNDRITILNRINQLQEDLSNEQG